MKQKNSQNSWDKLFRKAFRKRKPSAPPPDFTQMIAMASGKIPVPQNLDPGTREIIDFLSETEVSQATGNLTEKIAGFFALNLKSVFEPVVSTFRFEVLDSVPVRGEESDNTFKTSTENGTEFDITRNLAGEAVFNIHANNRLKRISLYTNGNLSESKPALSGSPVSFKISGTGVFRVVFKYADSSAESVLFTIEA